MRRFRISRTRWRPSILRPAISIIFAPREKGGRVQDNRRCVVLFQSSRAHMSQCAIVNEFTSPSVSAAFAARIFCRPSYTMPDSFSRSVNYELVNLINSLSVGFLIEMRGNSFCSSATFFDYYFAIAIDAQNRLC
jgi:hypothetical protein